LAEFQHPVPVSRQDLSPGLGLVIVIAH